MDWDFLYFIFFCIIAARVASSPSPAQHSSSESLIENNNPYSSETPIIPNYNKLIAPTTDHNPLIFVVARLKVREVVDVDTVQETLTVDAELELSWVDWKLREYCAANCDWKKDNLIRYDADILSKVWKPDIYIDELAGVERLTLLTKPIRIFIQTKGNLTGSVTYRARQVFKLNCNMEFRYYPADRQTCVFTIRSLSYPTSIIRLLWTSDKSAFLDETQNSNFDFLISEVEPGEELSELLIHYQVTPDITANYSALSFTLQVKRNVMYHMLQTYLPSILLVKITWICFLLPTDMVEARVGVSMTTLLTLTAMFTAVREQSPEVSYVKAIDVWMVFCIFLVFLAVVLFTAIHWTHRKLRKNNARSRPYKHSRKFARIARLSSYAFQLFVVLFISFITVYALGLFWLSGYCDWSPSNKYNAIEDSSAGASNKMYSRLEKHFEGREEKEFLINNDMYIAALTKAVALAGHANWDQVYDSEKNQTSLPSHTLFCKP